MLYGWWLTHLRIWDDPVGIITYQNLNFKDVVFETCLNTPITCSIDDRHKIWFGDFIPSRWNLILDRGFPPHHYWNHTVESSTRPVLLSVSSTVWAGMCGSSDANLLLRPPARDSTWDNRKCTRSRLHTGTSIWQNSGTYREPGMCICWFQASHYLGVGYNGPTLFFTFFWRSTVNFSGECKFPI